MLRIKKKDKYNRVYGIQFNNLSFGFILVYYFIYLI